jgi:hypothetical protein
MKVSSVEHCRSEEDDVRVVHWRELSEVKRSYGTLMTASGQPVKHEPDGLIKDQKEKSIATRKLQYGKALIALFEKSMVL